MASQIKSDLQQHLSVVLASADAWLSTCHKAISSQSNQSSMTLKELLFHVSPLYQQLQTGKEVYMNNNSNESSRAIKFGHFFIIQLFALSCCTTVQLHRLMSELYPMGVTGRWSSLWKELVREWKGRRWDVSAGELLPKQIQACCIVVPVRNGMLLLHFHSNIL